MSPKVTGAMVERDEKPPNAVLRMNILTRGTPKTNPTTHPFEVGAFRYDLQVRGVLAIGFLAVSFVIAPAATICLDPGHPSEVGRGTAGRKITELKAAWLVAVELKGLLQKDGHRVVMTKTREDEFVRNRRRAEIANAAKSDLMLRLHLDAATESGFASYYPARSGTTQGFTGPPLYVREASKQMAIPFHDAAVAVLKGHLRDRGLRTEQKTAIGAKQGALTGSIFSKVPVILVEMAVLSQHKDDLFMSTAKGRSRMALALRAGVRAALAAKPRKTRQ